MANVTLGILKQKILFRAEQENDDYIDDANLTLMINDSIGALREIINNQDQFHFISSTDITSSGVATLPLPADLHEIKGVDLIQGDQAITLESFNFNERNHYNSPYWYLGSFDKSIYKYRPHGENLLITPLPAQGEVFRLWYMPVHTQLTQDSDTFNFYNHWDEWVVLDTAIKCMKKEGDPLALELAQDLTVVEDRIKTAARRRNAGMPETGTDVDQLRDDIYPWSRY